MNLNFYTLSVIYLVYSFLGWVGETVVATIKGRQFTNRGMASGPFCFVYGTAGVLLAVGLADLRTNWLALFAGSFLIATVVEWVTAKFLERVHHRRWWDYSGKKFNLDGYVCLQYSVLWGVLGAVSVRWGNDLLLRLCAVFPPLLFHIAVWVSMSIAALDQISAAVVVERYAAKHPRLEQLGQELGKGKSRLQQKIAASVERRIQKAYPEAARPEPTTTAEKAMSFSDLVWLFVVGACLGDVVETIFCRGTAGVWMSRSSLVWGPFSVVWGLALVLAAVLLRGSERKSESRIFWFGVILGGAYEYVCSAVTELLFGTVFWDYSGFKFNLGGRINLLYCFFWGFAAVIWFKNLYPILHHVIERILHRSKYLLTTVVAVFMICNIIVSMLALIRYDTREHSPKPKAHWEEVMEHYYPDETMRKIYPNAK